jgi:hypothetical protein
MSNVIAPKERKGVGRMYRSRFIALGSAALIICSGVSALALLPSYLVLHADAAALAPQGPRSADQADRAALAQTETELSLVAPFASSATSSAGVVAIALAERVSGVSVDHISFTVGDPSTLVLSGHTSSPSKLDSYRKALAADALFESVTVPVSDLVGSQDGSFTMTLTGSF